MAHKAVFFNLEPWGKDYMLESAALKTAGVSLGFENYILNGSHLPEDADFDIAGVFAESKVDAAVVEKLPNLKCIATLSTGFDHIDLAAAKARGIAVSSVPSYGEGTVAEYAFALLLALSRKICEGRRRVHEEGKFTIDGLRGFDLGGKTIGIVGTGRIGQHAVMIAKGFGMNVLAFDIYKNEAFAKEAGFPYVSLEELLAKSDIVPLHVPATPETYHLLNAKNLPLVKRGAYLVNTSRGAVIETAALVESLKIGQLGGAGLDVLEEEGALKGDGTAGHEAKTLAAIQELVAMPNVIVTPHNAFNSKEAFLRILDTTIENIVAFVGGAPKNLVQ